MIARNTFLSFSTSLILCSNILTPAPKKIQTRGTETPKIENEQELAWTDIYKKYKNSVLQIITRKEYFDFFSPYKKGSETSVCGSGFIISQDGQVLTNYHVVESAKTVEAQLSSLGKSKFQMEVLSIDPVKDIALLKMKKESLELFKKQLKVDSLTCFSLANSNLLEEAQEIMILGYPLGQDNLKMSLGHISGKESFYSEDLIQTTAPINPGNSGGPAVNKFGKVIGISVSKVSETDGIGYLIPSSIAEKSLVEMKNFNVVRGPFLGVIHEKTTTETLEYLKVPDEFGIYVIKILQNSIFCAAGVKEGDVLYMIDNFKIDNDGNINIEGNAYVPFGNYVKNLPTGTKFNITIFRNGQKKVLPATVTRGKPYKIASTFLWLEETPDYEIIGGMVVEDMTGEYADILGAVIKENPRLFFSFYKELKYYFMENNFTPRVVIYSVLSDSQAYENDLLSFQVLDTVNGEKVNTVAEFRKAILKHSQDEYITIKTDGGAFFALSIDKILDEEDNLAEMYHYKKSDLVKKLEEVRN